MVNKPIQVTSDARSGLKTHTQNRPANQTLFNFRHIFCLQIVCCLEYKHKSLWKTVANCSHKLLFIVVLVLCNPLAT